MADSRVHAEADAEWPGPDRRSPRLGDRLYPPLAGLARTLSRAVATELGTRRDLVVVDLAINYLVVARKGATPEGSA
jgi:hypothetical protein